MALLNAGAIVQRNFVSAPRRTATSDMAAIVTPARETSKETFARAIAAHP
jgi:hypothetical protein